MEKSGTIHMALGSAYPQTDGRNLSAIHWDMIKGMKKARVYADGDLIYENGVFYQSYPNNLFFLLHVYINPFHLLLHAILTFSF